MRRFVADRGLAFILITSSHPHQDLLRHLIACQLFRQFRAQPSRVCPTCLLAMQVLAASAGHRRQALVCCPRLVQRCITHKRVQIHQLSPTEHMGSYSRFVCKHSKCVLVGVAINMSRHAPQASFHRAILSWSAITKRRTSAHGCCGSVVSRCYDIWVNRGTSEA